MSTKTNWKQTLLHWSSCLDVSLRKDARCFYARKWRCDTFAVPLTPITITNKSSAIILLNRPHSGVIYV